MGPWWRTVVWVQGDGGHQWSELENARADVDSSDHTEPRLGLEHVIPLPQVGDRLGTPDAHFFYSSVEFKI